MTDKNNPFEWAEYATQILEMMGMETYSSSTIPEFEKLGTLPDHDPDMEAMEYTFNTFFEEQECPDLWGPDVSLLTAAKTPVLRLPNNQLLILQDTACDQKVGDILNASTTVRDVATLGRLLADAQQEFPQYPQIEQYLEYLDLSFLRKK